MNPLHSCNVNVHYHRRPEDGTRSAFASSMDAAPILLKQYLFIILFYYCAIFNIIKVICFPLKSTLLPTLKEILWVPVCIIFVDLTFWWLFREYLLGNPLWLFGCGDPTYPPRYPLHFFNSLQFCSPITLRQNPLLNEKIGKIQSKKITYMHLCTRTIHPASSTADKTVFLGLAIVCCSFC